MFVLGHLGVGSRLLLRWRHALPAWPLYFGCLLPDLIDKPLYYGLLALHRHSALITGTRTFGHTLLFLLAFVAAAAARRDRVLWAIAAGIATHFFLDIVGEFVVQPEPQASIWLAIFFPLLGVRFPIAPFTSMLEHLRMTASNWYTLAGELLGAAILLRALWRRHHPS